MGGGLPARSGLPLLRQLAQLDGQCGMELHPVVDLGDRRGTPLDLLVGGFQRLDRGNPLAGGAAGRGEVAGVFAVDALDQQRLGTRQRGGVTRGQVKGPGQRIATGQVHRVCRRRLQNPLGMPQFGVHRLGQHGLHAVVCLVAAVLFATRLQDRQLCLGSFVEALVIDEVESAGADFSGDLGSDIGMGRLDLLDFFFRRPIFGLQQQVECLDHRRLADLVRAGHHDHPLIGKLDLAVLDAAIILQDQSMQFHAAPRPC